MARSRYNYFCVTESGEVKKYASQSLEQIVDDTPYEYTCIVRQDLHSEYDTDYEELEWHD